jgi:hypothetical protein
MMDVAGSHDPYLAIPGLDVFVGREMIAEVGKDVPYLQAAAQSAEFGFRITASRATASLTREYEGRLPVGSLRKSDALDGLLRPVLPWEEPFVVEVWINPDSVPRTWVELGLTQGAEFAGIKAAEVKAVLAAALKSEWDCSITADFLGFELFTTALRAGPPVSTMGRDEQRAIEKALASRHLEKAVEALSAGDRSTAAGLTTAAAGCLGVPRQAVHGLTATMKYGLSTGRRGPNRLPLAIPEELQRLLDAFSPSELQHQTDLIVQAAGRIVEEGRAAWCERQFFFLDRAGFPFLRSVPEPIEISGYGAKVYREGMKLIERAALNTSRWAFLSPFLMEHLILSGWSWLLAVAPPYLLKELAREARVLPEDSVMTIADWDGSDPEWARRLAEHGDSSNRRAAAVARRLL